MSLGDKVTLSPAERQLSPCKKQWTLKVFLLIFLSLKSLQTPRAPILPHELLAFHREWGVDMQEADPSKSSDTVMAVPEQHFPPPQTPPAYVGIAHTRLTVTVSLWWHLGRDLLTCPTNIEHGARRAPKVLCSARGTQSLRASQNHVSALGSKHASFTIASSPCLLPTSLGKRSQTCPCHWRCVNKRICACLGACGSAIHSTETIRLCSLSVGIQNTCHRSETRLQWLSSWVTSHEHLSLQKTSGRTALPGWCHYVCSLQYHWGTARCVWFGDPTWDFPVFGFSQSWWTLGHFHGHLQKGKDGLTACWTMQGQTQLRLKFKSHCF